MAWLVAACIAGVALIVVLVTILRDEAIESRPAPGPDWVMPAPSAFRTVTFERALGGYERREVDATIEAMARVYEELYLAAGPSVIAMAHTNLARGLARAKAQESAPESAQVRTPESAQELEDHRPEL